MENEDKSSSFLTCKELSDEEYARLVKDAEIKRYRDDLMFLREVFLKHISELITTLSDGLKDIGFSDELIKDALDKLVDKDILSYGKHRT